MRKIIHIDMDAFFAAIEQRDFPHLQGKPIAIGGKPNTRSVIATASYEARKYGIGSAMPIDIAIRRLPSLIIRPGRFEAYRQASETIRRIFLQYTLKVEPLSLDEAYLDVTDCKQYQNSATFIARAIRKEIYQQTQLTASAGVSYNKFLAKMASDVNKPNGECVILPNQALDFLAKLPIGKFYGIGQKTEQKMKSLRVYTGRDLQHKSREELEHFFGKSGVWFYNIARGLDEREVGNRTERKSISTERTFVKNLTTEAEVLFQANRLSQKILLEMKKDYQKCSAKTLVVKIRDSHFKTITRQIALNQTASSLHLQSIQSLVQKLICENLPSRPSIRLLGVGFKVENS